MTSPVTHYLKSGQRTKKGWENAARGQRCFTSGRMRWVAVGTDAYSNCGFSSGTATAMGGVRGELGQWAPIDAFCAGLRQILDISETDTESVVEPDSMTDDLTGISVTVVEDPLDFMQ